jgi:hypothetical protein
MADREKPFDNSSTEFEQHRESEAVEHADDRKDSIPYSGKESVSAAERARRNLNAKLANPLAGYSHDVLRKKCGNFARKYQIGEAEDIRAFELGAVLAQDPTRYDSIEGLEQEELNVLRKEFTNRWAQPKLMYLVIVLCSVCAAVQGMGLTSLSIEDIDMQLTRTM